MMLHLWLVCNVPCNLAIRTSPSLWRYRIALLVWSVRDSSRFCFKSNVGHQSLPTVKKWSHKLRVKRISFRHHRVISSAPAATKTGRAAVTMLWLLKCHWRELRARLAAPSITKVNFLRTVDMRIRRWSRKSAKWWITIPMSASPNALSKP